MVDADHQNVVPRDLTEGRTHVLVATVGSGGSGTVTLDPDPFQEVFQPGHQEGLAAAGDWDLSGEVEDGGAELRPRV